MLRAGLEGELSPDILRQVAGMVDVLADHVTNVQGPIRAHGGVHRAEPLIGRGEEILAGRGVRGGRGAALAVLWGPWLTRVGLAASQGRWTACWRPVRDERGEWSSKTRGLPVLRGRFLAVGAS